MASEMVERLAYKRAEQDVSYEDQARWWLNAIAEELGSVVTERFSELFAFDEDHRTSVSLNQEVDLFSLLQPVIRRVFGDDLCWIIGVIPQDLPEERHYQRCLRRLFGQQQGRPRWRLDRELSETFCKFHGFS